MIEDMLGQTWGVGDYIVYATSNSSSAKMTMGKVLALEPKYSKRYNYETRQYEQEERLIGHQVKVQPVLDNRGYRSETKGGTSRTVILSSTINAIRVDPSLANFVEPA